MDCVLQANSDGPTDGWTDRPTNRAAYRVTCTQLIEVLDESCIMWVVVCYKCSVW